VLTLVFTRARTYNAPVKREYLPLLLAALVFHPALVLTAQCPPSPCPTGADCFAPSEILTFAVSPTGEWLATTVADGSILVWNVASGTKHYIVKCVEISSEALAFSPDGNTLAVGDANGRIRFLENPNGKEVTPPVQDRESIEGMTFSNDGTYLIVVLDKGFSLWTWPELRRKAFIPATGVSSMAVSYDSKKIAYGIERGTVVLWDVEKGTASRSLTLGHRDWSNALAFSPDGRLLASGNGHKSVVIWDLEYGTVVQNLTKHSAQVVNVGFLLGGQTLFSMADDRTVRTWDVATGEQKRVWKADPGFLSHDGKLFFTLTPDPGKVDCWDFPTLKKIRTFAYRSPNGE
jgi:WD40 repeat protein